MGQSHQTFLEVRLVPRRLREAEVESDLKQYCCGSPFPASVQDPGLHIWRVEKLKPVPLARENHGIFFSGDSYLVLHNGPEEVSHLHLWIGQQSSRDEQGACAVLAVHLNTLLGERPVQHREVQGNESDLFMSYFPRGLKYQEGGVESAFHKTNSGATPAAIKKLYQVKGKKNIRATERALSWDSFNTGDCFILDLGQSIFAWCGAKSNILERNKARDLALAIRDSERQGKAQVEIITDGEEPAEMIQVLGAKPALKEGNPEEDLTADKTNAQAAALYKVSDATGQMNLTKVADSSPFASELLIPDDCFVLDNGLCGKIYIWKGRKANEKERQAALQVADGFISRMRYSPNTQPALLVSLRPWDPVLPTDAAERGKGTVAKQAPKLTRALLTSLLATEDGSYRERHGNKAFDLRPC
ncbi:Macrophage-capping protein [Microtus ochrogaster]|uniref:Macrophage-capping protein n=1 Tax=Microtus ochrogaster TaxID=79684 RepID=A0A8J6L1V8_MICOH|nr:Macrophage-capping protein [Microtus ochrogaster]